ncbi:MAG: hypothetical protein ACKVOP_14500 [Sphingomonadaceae bacterium]
MDLSFSRRRRPVPADKTPTLDALLSETAARAAVTPSAQAQARLATAAPVIAADPRIAIFAGDRKAAPCGSRFADADIAEAPVTSGQPT